MKNAFKLMMLLCGAFALNSCLNFDEPGDELEMDKKIYKYDTYYTVTCTVEGADVAAGDSLYFYEFKIGEKGDTTRTPVKNADSFTGPHNFELDTTTAPGHTATVTLNGAKIATATPHVLMDNEKKLEVKATFTK